MLKVCKFLSSVSIVVVEESSLLAGCVFTYTLLYFTKDTSLFSKILHLLEH